MKLKMQTSQSGVEAKGRGVGNEALLTSHRGVGNEPSDDTPTDV